MAGSNKSLSGSSSLTEATGAPVILVMLRQPRMNRPDEMRSDPFWEFGSFGLTGCHQRNLMHPKKAALLNGVRFAFVQGGELGFRLVYLTPPLNATPCADRTEVLWEKGEMPFRYGDAPLVLDQEGASQMPALRQMLAGVDRNGWMGRLASKFRTRREPLPEPVAQEMLAAYEAACLAGGESIRARRYEEALPVRPPKVDRARRKTYSGLRAQFVGK